MNAGYFLRDTLQGIQCDRHAQLAVSISPLSFDHGAFASGYLVRSSSAFASFRTQSLSDWSARSAAASKAFFSMAVHITTIGTFRSLDCGFFFAICRLYFFPDLVAIPCLTYIDTIDKLLICNHITKNMGAASGRKLTSLNLNHRACPNIGPLLRTAILSTRALFILETKKATSTLHADMALCFRGIPAQS